MRLELTATEQAFRDEVREFFTRYVPSHWRQTVRAGLRLKPEDLITYQKLLAARGWGAPTWPKEYGGTGWSPVELCVFWTEAARADAPMQFHQGLELIGPIIFTYGTEAQKNYYLPRIINADDWWCQGYSEPGAGSDLASLRSRAERDGDDYIINGQKTWTSYAHVATQVFLLVRTSTEERRQQGISLVLAPMTTQGFKVSGISTMDEKYHTNEMFMDNARVPIANRIGEEGRGWEYGKVLLDRERMVAAANVIFLSQTLRGIEEAARRRKIAGVPLIDNPGFAAKLAQYRIELTGLETMVLRLLDDERRGVPSGPRGSMVKLRWSQLLQAGTELWIEAIGQRAAHFQAMDGGPLDADMPQALQGALYARVTSIYGGTSEIQHNIIARRALGL